MLFDARREVLTGNAALARQKVEEALRLSRAPDQLVIAAAVLGPAGDVAAAERFAEEATRKMPPPDTLFHSIELPLARAAIELGRKKPEQALEALKPAAPYERGRFPVFYLRGLAHLEAGHAAEAVADFQRILENRAWQPANVLYPLAQLGLARTAALAGDTAKSRRAYQDFLALWKDADPDVPVLVQGKAEYAKLAGS
jgi:tetratricopeptide (TPR) repeat protein